MIEQFRNMKKIELHHHLEGSIRTSSYLDIMRSHHLEDRVKVDFNDLAAVHKAITVDFQDGMDFSAAFSCFGNVRHCICDREAIARLVFEAAEDAALDNVVYLELRVSPGPLLKKGIPAADILSGIEEGASLAEKRYPIRVVIIIGISRELDRDNAEQVMDIAIAGLPDHVRAVDVLSDEKYPAEVFVAPLFRAKEAGLHVTLHAGEFGPALNVYTACKYLGAERIGHATHLAGPCRYDVVKALKESGVHVECNPSSNHRSGLIRNLEDYPFKVLMDNNIPFSISTDDPAVLGYTLSEEYLAVSKAWGLDYGFLEELNRKSIDYIFDDNYKLTLKNILENK